MQGNTCRGYQRQGGESESIVGEQHPISGKVSNSLRIIQIVFLSKEKRLNLSLNRLTGKNFAYMTVSLELIAKPIHLGTRFHTERCRCHFCCFFQKYAVINPINSNDFSIARDTDE